MDRGDRFTLEFQALMGAFSGDVPVQALLYIYHSTIGGDLFCVIGLEFVHGSFLSDLDRAFLFAGIFWRHAGHGGGRNVSG